MATEIVIPSEVNVDKLPCPPGINPSAWKAMRKTVKYQKYMEWRQTQPAQSKPAAASYVTPTFRAPAQATSPTASFSPSSHAGNAQADPQKMEMYQQKIDSVIAPHAGGLKKLLDAMNDEEARKFPDLGQRMKAAMVGLRIGKIATEKEVADSLNACIRALQDFGATVDNEISRQVEEKKLLLERELKQVESEMAKLEERRQAAANELSNIDARKAISKESFMAVYAPKLDELQRIDQAFDQHVVK